MKTRVAIFGATGSIGAQSLEVLRKFSEKFEITGLTAMQDEKNLSLFAKEFNLKTDQFCLNPNDEQIKNIVKNADYIINAVPGFAGINFSTLSIDCSSKTAPKTILSANKESLAVAGKFLKQKAEENFAKILPIDSEASAIWQLAHEHGFNNIQKVILTCSGGPFFGYKTDQLENVTLDEALKHPTWSMGKKVSIDSATLVNKILEIYEIHNLFDLNLKNINIIIHRQSLAHSFVKLKSKATRFHTSQNDMKIFISYALNFPNQPVSPWPILRTKNSDLKFDEPDEDTFKPLKWFKIYAGNPNFPIILNAANDIAVEWFLQKKIKFLDIYRLIEQSIDKFIFEVPVKNQNELYDFHDKIQKFTLKNIT